MYHLFRRNNVLSMARIVLAAVMCLLLVQSVLAAEVKYVFCSSVTA